MQRRHAIHTLMNWVLTRLNDMTLRRAAQRDEKTGLFSAYYFHHRFRQAFVHARRFCQPLALIIIDLDSFKNVNDTYGHLAGDAVLSEVGAIIREQLCRPGIAGRFGGDEFTIVLPDTTAEEASIVAERIRRVVASAGIYTAESFDAIRITASLGIAQLSPLHRVPNNLFHAADMALLQAKRQGRNRIICAPHRCSLMTNKLERAISEELPIEATEEASPIRQNAPWQWILHPRPRLHL
jgi:diguanylate cyclase (GGDEF)-like protein